jgi:hypothetical protein
MNGCIGCGSAVSKWWVACASMKNGSDVRKNERFFFSGSVIGLSFQVRRPAPRHCKSD